MRVDERLAGMILYLGGILLSIIRPPVDRMACMTVPEGKVVTAINPFFLVLELGLVMLGSALLSTGHEFKNYHGRNGWLGVATGLGTAFIGGYSGIDWLFLFGIALATLGLIVYKMGGSRDANG